MQFLLIVQTLVTTVCCAQYAPLSITVVRPAELDSFSKGIEAEDHESHEVKLGFEKGFLLQTRGLILLIEKEARKHFGCSSLVGIEADSADKIHLNEYIFANELMTPFLSNVSNRFSYISAAILEETYFGERPWYRVNRSAIREEHESLWYGRGWGCTFAERSCFDFIADRTRQVNISPTLAVLVSVQLVHLQLELACRTFLQTTSLYSYYIAFC
uniref:Leishmanolysin-like peptidase n=1 Tax=Angiostrongylus cantonensis TaxID=6313 RepID=A0A158P9D6_ANGCA